MSSATWSHSVFRTADEANGYLSNFRKLVTEVGKGPASLNNHNLSFHVLELELV